MHFCIKCDNMYYLAVPSNDSDTLTYYCKNCGYMDDILSNTAVNILKTNVSSNNAMSKINEYTKYDPTLPVASDSIVCPNEQCHTNVKNTNKRILQIRYDDTHMKYAYLCSTCDHVWENKVH